MTTVLITQSAWSVITREISYFADLQKGKEAVVYPLFGWLRAEDCLKPFWENLELEDLDYFIIPYAFAPPRKYARHSGARAGFSADTEEEKQEFIRMLNSWRDNIKADFPNLELGYVHSHWFAKGWTWPSHGKDCDYPRIHGLWQDLLKVNLNTPLEVILCRRWGFMRRWKACSFGFDQKQRVVSLGEAKIVSDHDYRVRKLLTRPYDMTTEGVQWEEREGKSFVDGLRPQRNFYGTTYLIKQENGRHITFHFPYYFPNTDKILYQLYDPNNKTWEKAKAFPITKGLFNLNIFEVVQNISKGDKNG